MAKIEHPIVEKIEKAFKEAFDSEVSFSTQLKRADLSEWDSLRHVLFLIAIEKQFGIKFDGTTASKMNSINEIVAEVHNRLSV